MDTKFFPYQDRAFVILKPDYNPMAFAYQIVGGISDSSFEYQAFLSGYIPEPELGPREWSPRTWKCLCKKPGQA